MQLNLNLLLWKLPEEWVDYASMALLYQFPIQYIALYNGEFNFKDSILYILKAEDAPSNPEFSGHCSLIAIGQLPQDRYNTAICDCICIEESKKLPVVLNTVVRLFQEYQEWERGLLGILNTDNPYEGLGEDIFKYFYNPVELINIGDRYLFHKYDENRPENREYFQEFYDDSYPPLDELQVIYATKGSFESYTYKEPAILVNGLYREEYLHSNLFIGERYVGKLFVSNLYHEFRPIDYSIIQCLAIFLAKAVDKHSQSVMVCSLEMERIIFGLLEQREAYTKKVEACFERQSWERHDYYFCALLKHTGTEKGHCIMTEHARFLQSILTDFFPLVLSDGIFLIIHQKESNGLEVQRSRLRVFTQTENYKSFSSSVFNDLAEISLRYQQVRVLSNLVGNSGGQGLVFFDDNIMKCVYGKCLEEKPISFYITERLNALLEYDKEKQTELFQTVESYLSNNLNIAKTLEQLHIHRSTFNYRIKRIEKILGQSLSNYHFRTYLQFVIGLLYYAES